MSSRRIRVTLLTILGVLVVFRLAQVAVGAAGLAWGYDFSAYWLAGRHVLEGQPLYSAAQLAGAYPPQQQFVYLYPPFFAVAVAPLSALFDDYRSAMWAWTGAGTIALVATVWATCRAGGLTRGVSAFLVVATLALPPVGFEMVMGNTHLLLVALLALAWLGIIRATRGGELAAGALVGIATLIKIFPVVLVLWFLLTRRYRAALAAVVAAGILALATVPIVGLAAWLDYPRVLANLAPPPELWSSLAPMALLAEFIEFGLARVIVLVIGLAILLWSARTQQTAISYSVAIMVSLLVVPTLYPHYLAVAVVPLILAVTYSASAAGSVLAYAGLLIGGQAALIDLKSAGLRAIALLGAIAPLAALLPERRRD